MTSGKGFRLVHWLLRIVLAIFIVFVMPALATAAWWISADRPAHWRSADWSSSGLLPQPDADRNAAIYILFPGRMKCGRNISTSIWKRRSTPVR